MSEVAGDKFINLHNYYILILKWLFMNDMQFIIDTYRQHGANKELAGAMYLVLDPLSFPRVEPGWSYELRRSATASDSNCKEMAVICLICGDSEMAKKYFEMDKQVRLQLGMPTEYEDKILKNMSLVQHIVAETTPIFNEIRNGRKIPLLESYGPEGGTIRFADLRLERYRAC